MPIWLTKLHERELYNGYVIFQKTSIDNYFCKNDKLEFNKLLSPGVFMFEHKMNRIICKDKHTDCKQAFFAILHHSLLTKCSVINRKKYVLRGSASSNLSKLSATVTRSSLSKMQIWNKYNNGFSEISYQA